MNDFERIADIFNKLSSDNSRNFKKDLLNQHKDDNQLALVFRLAYDPYLRFNVARVDVENHPSVFGFEKKELYNFNEFVIDLERLMNKEYTGFEALAHVSRIYNILPTSFQPYLEKILQKDLKIGVSTATINETWPEWIPEFKLGLCERWKKVKSIKYPMFAERKIDGVRVIAFVNPTTQEVRMLSRSGLPYDNFKHIEKDLLSTNYENIFFDEERIKEVGIVLDGEIIDGNFQGIMNSARRLYDVDCNSAVFHIWDMLYGDEFFNQTCSMTLEERKTGLDLVLFPYYEKPSDRFIKVMDYMPIDSHEELIECFRKFFFDEGFEGVILKDSKSMYIYSSGSKRGKAWLKYKIQDYNKENGVTPIEYTVLATDVYSGNKNTKFKDVLGGFTYRGYAELGNGEKVLIEGRCGGGYKDSQRFDFWERRNSLIGSVFDIEAQEITTDESGKHSLRFPVFLRFRPELSPKDAGIE